MDMVRKEIFDTIEDRDDLNLTKVAMLIDSSKQALSDYEKGRKNIGFRKLIRLAYLLFPHPREKMYEWCLKLDSVESIKQAFEYAAVIRDVDLLKKLLTKHKSEHGVIGECVKIYTIIYNFMTNKIKGTDLLEEINKIKTPSDKALKILLKIIEAYYYYYIREFWLMLKTSKNIVPEILSLSDKREKFIKESYFHRICEIYGPAYLHLNNLQLARECGEVLINANFCAKTVSDGYFIVGMSFLLEDKKKCLENLQASYDILKDSGDQELINLAKYNLNFAKAYHGEELDNDAPGELKAFFSAKWSEGNVLSDLEKDINLEEEKEFQLYYRALAAKSTDDLIECYGLFFNQTNFFFSGVVAKDLERLGEKSNLIESLIKFKINKEGELKIEKDFISCFNSFDSLLCCNYI
jgi:transcriptional regulator with XRE-family HTH domain